MSDKSQQVPSEKMEGSLVDVSKLIRIEAHVAPEAIYLAIYSGPENGKLSHRKTVRLPINDDDDYNHKDAAPIRCTVRGGERNAETVCVGQ